VEAETGVYLNPCRAICRDQDPDPYDDDEPCGCTEIYDNDCIKIGGEGYAAAPANPPPNNGKIRFSWYLGIDACLTCCQDKDAVTIKDIKPSLFDVLTEQTLGGLDAYVIESYDEGPDWNPCAAWGGEKKDGDYRSDLWWLELPAFSNLQNKAIRFEVEVETQQGCTAFFYYIVGFEYVSPG
jgi:hypothetical protein